MDTPSSRKTASFFVCASKSPAKPTRIQSLATIVARAECTRLCSGAKTGTFAPPMRPHTRRSGWTTLRRDTEDTRRADADVAPVPAHECALELFRGGVVRYGVRG